MADEIKVRSFVHKTTGLIVALSDDVPGFIVHAHSDDEMEAKLAAEYAAFIEASEGRTVRVIVEAYEPAPGFGPPAFMLSTQPAKAA